MPFATYATMRMLLRPRLGTLEAGWCDGLDRLAAVCTARGHPDVALRLWGAVDEVWVWLPRGQPRRARVAARLAGFSPRRRVLREPCGYFCLDEFPDHVHARSGCRTCARREILNVLANLGGYGSISRTGPTA